ncbi:MAG: DegT/DnrJ/EryC1/StrS aminotransferase family protein [Candidatus Omnitrophica bacterium]|nr:DegT/DnrJ/EryC1/StrS aminotransferase family protein [Candidatus Omnitrophota bacterium]
MSVLSLYPGFGQVTVVGNFLSVLQEFTGAGNLRLIASARSGLTAGLRALGCGRMDELLVPPYLGQCVLSALNRSSFPAMSVSSRTRGMLVFHQFGFPQKIDLIEAAAMKKGYFIINDCAHLLSGRYQGRDVVRWGDVTVMSFPKFFPSVLGGALMTAREDLLQRIDQQRAVIDEARFLDEAYDILKRVKSSDRLVSVLDVEAVFGYLPDLLAFPDRALAGLPADEKALGGEIQRRVDLWSLLKKHFPSRVPVCDDSDVVPFAIPLELRAGDREDVLEDIREQWSVDLPVLHFDFARNMLAPDYRRAVVIGCHEGWKRELVVGIVDQLQRAWHEPVYG